MRNQSLISTFLTLLMLLPASGQQAPAPAAAPSGGTVTFKATSNLVIVNVTAKDKSGMPVQGLKAEDFTVLEDGKPQKVSVFEYQKISSTPEPPKELTLDEQFKLPEAPKTTITSSTPGQIQYHDKRLMVFFFDFSSMQVPDQLRAQDGALEYLKKSVTKDDVVAVLFYASAIQVLTDFTSDRDVLTQVIKNMPIGEASELAALADTGDENGEDTQAAFVADETEFNIFSTDKKLAAIEQAAKMLASFPEKKALVYFSGGVTRNGLDNEAQLQSAINAATKANLAIYSIDTRGLTADPPGGGASKGGSRGAGNFNGSAVNSQRSSQLASQDTLFTLASETGGKSFFDSNDIALGITRTQEAMGSYYLVGYYSSNNAADGKFRKISVKLNNPKLAAKLEHREGYYAEKIWGKLNAQDKEQQLKEALSAGDPATDLPLQLQIDYFRITPTAYLVPVSIKIPGSVIALAAKGGAATTQFDFAGQIQDERRAVVGNVRDKIEIKLNAATVAAAPVPAPGAAAAPATPVPAAAPADPKAPPTTAARKSFQYDAGFTLEPGKYHMKFVVRENITGKMGTFESRFTVPDLSADTSGLKLSSVILSNQREPVTAAVGMAERFSRKEVGANPLIVGAHKVVPNITHVFRRNQSMYVNFDVYDALPDPADTQKRRVKVSMSLFNKKGVKTFEVGPVEATQLAATRPEAVPVQIEIPLKDVTRGEYVCQINVVDEVGRKFAFPRASMIVQ
ncbi:MAG: VWA domain-containing protein [Candidatus Solibacter sp.]